MTAKEAAKQVDAFEENPEEVFYSESLSETLQTIERRSKIGERSCPMTFRLDPSSITMLQETGDYRVVASDYSEEDRKRLNWRIAATRRVIEKLKQMGYVVGECATAFAWRISW